MPFDGSEHGPFHPIFLVLTPRTDPDAYLQFMAGFAKKQLAIKEVRLLAGRVQDRRAVSATEREPSLSVGERKFLHGGEHGLIASEERREVALVGFVHLAADRPDRCGGMVMQRLFRAERYIPPATSSKPKQRRNWQLTET